jgi:hypothetical protein
MTNLLAQAINCDNYCFPKTWPTDRENPRSIIGEWLTTKALPGLTNKQEEIALCQKPIG